MITVKVVKAELVACSRSCIHWETSVFSPACVFRLLRGSCVEAVNTLWAALTWAAGRPNQLTSLKTCGGSLESATRIHCEVTDPWRSVCRCEMNFLDGSCRLCWNQILRVSCFFFLCCTFLFRTGGKSEQAEKGPLFVSKLCHYLLDMMIIITLVISSLASDLWTKFTLVSVSDLSLHLFSAEMLRDLRCFTIATSSWRSKIKPCRMPSASWRKGNFLHSRFILLTAQCATNTSNYDHCFQGPCRRVWSMCHLGGEPEK